MGFKARDGENSPFSQDVKVVTREKAFPVQRAGETEASEDL